MRGERKAEEIRTNVDVDAARTEIEGQRPDTP
jgi:hypothetical protein